MTPARYRTVNGQIETLDLDSVVDVVNGWSSIRPGWHGFVIYIPVVDRFVEFMSTPPDIRGGSQEYAVEVDPKYIESNYEISKTKIDSLISNPYAWKYIRNRQ